MCGQIWSLRLLEVLTRNRQSAVELSRRTIRTRAQSLRMFTIPPRKRLSVTSRLAIRARRVTRTRIIIVIIVIIINTQIAFKTHPCNIHTKEREKDIAYHRVYFFLFSRVLFHHHSKRLFFSRDEKKKKKKEDLFFFFFFFFFFFTFRLFLRER